MRKPDLDRDRCEEPRTLDEFLRLYNEDLPDTFPKVSKKLLEEYRDTHLELFKTPGIWSLDVHRKRVMDWMRTHAVSRA